MRFLHTSDLHLGKRLGEISLYEDQRFILEQIKDIVFDNKCDALVIAGDIYQRSDPSAESMALFSDFIYELSSKGIIVIAVSGNHDSGLRLSYLSRIVRGSGVYLSEVFNGSVEKLQVKDGNGKTVNFFLLPFIRPSDVRKHFQDSSVNSYNEAVRYIVERLETDEKEINVIVAHQFITGSLTCESEETYIGGLDNVDSAVFQRFDYVALGHLHRPQHAGSDVMRYSGSPLKYSISESDDNKICVLVDIQGKEDIRIEEIPLTPLHDVIDIHGMFNDIMMMPRSDDYVRIEINDEDVPPDARVILSSTLFPNMFRFAVKNSKTSDETVVDISNDIENRSLMELFSDFYSLQNNGVMPDESRIKVMKDIIEEIKGPENETD